MYKFRAVCDHTGPLSLSSLPGLTRQSMGPRVKPGDDEKKRQSNLIANRSDSLDFGLRSSMDQF